MVTRVRLSKIAVSSRSQLGRVAIAGLLCLLVTAGCGGVKQSPPGAQPQNTPPPAAAEAAPPVAPSASSTEAADGGCSTERHRSVRAGESCRRGAGDRK